MLSSWNAQISRRLICISNKKQNLTLRIRVETTGRKTSGAKRYCVFYSLPLTKSLLESKTFSIDTSVTHIISLHLLCTVSLKI